MVAYAHGCDPGRLRRHLDGTLDEEEQDELASHLDFCAACREELDELATDGPSWRSFGEFLGGEAEVSARTDSLPRRTGAGALPRPPGDEDDRVSSILNLLDRPEDPRHLGRLGPYEVLEVVGRGGMGIVLKANDGGLGRTVAIKVLGLELAFLSSARRRFAREAKAAASVAHEHVVAIHAVDSWKGLPYLVMQYVPGVSLQQRIDREGPLAIIEVLRIGMQVASGLAAAHAQGLVHRDIKPANILLENGVERVKITDFGLARAAADASVSQSGVVCGTPQYMAPEQARCEVVDPRADLFSLGSLLYAMCTGHSPFRAETTMAVLRRVCEDDPRPIRPLNPEVPTWLAEIITKLLAKRPDDRFQSAAEVAALLGRCVAYVELPVEGPPPFRLERRRTGLADRRRRTMIGAGALVSLAGIVAVAESMREGAREAGKDRTPAGLAPMSPIPGRPAPSGGFFVAYRQRLGKPRPTDADLADLLRPVPLGTTDQIAPWPFGIVSSACYSPDGRLLALGCGDGSVTLYDTATRRICSTRGVYAGRIWSVAFSPDGSTLATASGDWNPRSRNGQVRLWDVPSGTFRAGLTDDGSLQLAVAYSPDGRTLAWAGRDRTIVLWDTESRSNRAVCRGHESTIRSLAFHPREPVLVSAGFDGSIRFWDARAGDPIGDPIRHDGRSSNRVAISPDGRLLAANSAPRSDEPGVEGPFPGWITIWDWETRKPLRRIDGFRFDILSIAFSPDGRTLASAGGYFDRGSELGLWDVATGDRLQGLQGHACWVESAIFSPDGGSLVSLGGADPYGGEVRVWDLLRAPSSAVR